MATSFKKLKKLNEVNKPLHRSTNREFLVKIGPLGSELLGLESRPLKNKERKKKNIGKIYRPSPSGKFAKRAKNNSKCLNVYFSVSSDISDEQTLEMAVNNAVWCSMCNIMFIFEYLEWNTTR